jgi:hypothetical protein
MPIMHYRPLLSVSFVAATALVALAGLSAPSSAQTAAAAAAPPIKPLGQPCIVMTDPFKGKLAGPDLPPGVIPVADADRSSILESDLPCQERVNPIGPEDIGLENLQRGFDFYSWRTFIAMNSPADGSSIDKSQPDTPTRWEDMDNFKQPLDVMLPVDMGPPKWPADRAAMEAEKVRLMPPACRAQYKPGTMVVKMIEESYNEPFKTGPLIDQQGRYAIFDILMNRRMFDYISKNDLFTKEGQQSQANFGLAVDFPVGQNAVPAKGIVADVGAFMLKVSWKILGAGRNQGQKFPHGERAGLHAEVRRSKGAAAAVPAGNSGIDRLPCRAQDREPSAVDMDIIRAR